MLGHKAYFVTSLASLNPYCIHQSDTVVFEYQKVLLLVYTFVEGYEVPPPKKRDDEVYTSPLFPSLKASLPPAPAPHNKICESGVTFDITSPPFPS